MSQVERAVRNEDLFRQMNDRLHLLETLSGRRDELERLVCECSALDCSRIIEISAADYLQVREGGTRFIVYPSDEHLNPEIECAVYRHERYWVVEKIGTAGGKAEELDEQGVHLL